MAVSLQLRASFEISSLYLKADGQTLVGDSSSSWPQCVWDLVQRGSSSISLRSSDGRYVADLQGSVGLVGDVSSAVAMNVLTLRDGSWRFLSSGKALALNAQDGSLRWIDVSRADNTSTNWTVHLSCNSSVSSFKVGVACSIISLTLFLQVNIRNAGTKRYLCLEGNELRINKDVAWGPEAVVTLEEVNGQYAMRTCTHEYLDQSGRITEEPSESSLFGLVVKGCRVAFQAVDGTFLSAGGPSNNLACRKDRISRDELFVLEPSRPQVTLTSYSNDMKVAFHEMRGDIVADGDKADDAVYFQLESSENEGIWFIRTHQNKLWQVVERGNAIRAETDEESESSEFQLEFIDDKVMIKSVKIGRYVTVRPNGHLHLSDDEPEEESQFILELVNRPAIVLQSPQGFVSQRDDSSVLSCNSLIPEVFRIEARNGRYSLSTDDEKYWSLSEDGDHIEAESAVPVAFLLQFLSETKLVIQTTENSFLCHSSNTDLMTTAKEAQSSECQWDFTGLGVAVQGRITPSPSPVPPQRNEIIRHDPQPQKPAAAPAPSPQIPKQEPQPRRWCIIL